MNEEINKIKDKMIHPKATTLNIKRVPTDTAEVFKKFANDEFVGDYGMALKKLVDMVLVDPLPFQPINQMLQDHENRLAKIENKPPSDVIAKTISGRIIRAQKKEEKEE